MKIKQVNLSAVDNSKFKQQYTGCIVLTNDKFILLQRSPDNCRTFPGMIATFGGHIEANETPVSAIIRELKEELGASVEPNELYCLGTITEEITQLTELVHIYFWHDKQNSIKGCYEDEPQYFSTITNALTHPKLMDDVRWAITECQKQELLKLYSKDLFRVYSSTIAHNKRQY